MKYKIKKYKDNRWKKVSKEMGNSIHVQNVYFFIHSSAKAKRRESDPPFCS